jgi:fibronectin-binding autotransporter adhesin
MQVDGTIGQSAPSAAIVKNGDGDLTLTAANTYSGLTSVNLGRLLPANANALGTGTNAAADGTVVNNGGTLAILGPITIGSERLVLNGPGNSGNGALQAYNAPSIWGGDVVLNTTGIAFNMFAPLTIAGRVTGIGDLSFGRDTLILTNPTNDYAGSTTIGNPGGGTSVLQLGSSGVIPDNSAVSVLVNSTLDVNGKIEMVGSLTGVGTVLFGGGTLFAGNNNSSTTFDGVLSGSGASTLGKVGAGTMTLTAVNNGFSGTAQILAGTLSLAATAQLPNATFTPITPGTLAGTGLAGPIVGIPFSGGSIAPGIGGPGVLTAVSLAMKNNTELDLEVNGTTAGTQYDQLAVTGTVALDGALSLTLGYGPAVGDTFRILNKISPGPIVGTFGGIPEGSSLSFPPATMTISYVGGDGNDVVLTVTGVTGSGPTITTTSPLPSGTVGTAYSTSLAAIGGTLPYTWTVPPGTLPSGLNLNASTGAITGTPTTAGPFSFTVTVTDNAAKNSSKLFSLTIAAAGSPTITTTSPLPGGTIGTAYATTLAATGGTPPYTWSVPPGTLPPGLNLNASTGAITGSPTTAGAFSFTVTVTDNAAQNASKLFSLTIAATPPPPSQPIPVLSPWMLVLLAGLVAFIGMRRRD